MTFDPRLRSAGLHVVALWSFAVAQPLYELLGRKPEFLIGHHATPGVVLLLVLGVSFAAPLLIAGIERGVAAVSLRLFRAVHLAVVAVLVGLFVLGALPRETSSAVALAIAGVVALAGTIAYARVHALAAVLAVLSAGALVFPLAFVLFTPVKRVVLPAAEERRGDAAIATDVPVVVVVLDELGLTPLVDAAGNIDAVRFPGFGALARDATWFRRATGAHWATEKAIPTILTGRRYDPAHPLLPLVSEYPDNLFTWLGERYGMNVVEPVTSLCPDRLCGGARELQPWVFASDLGILYLHVLLPRALRPAWLPDVDVAWGGFAAGAAVDGDAPPSTNVEVLAGIGEALKEDRRASWRSFVERLRGGATLNFLHVLLPHDPYRYLPSGRLYPSGGALGLLPTQRWSDDATLIVPEYQRYLLQIGMVDALVGELIATMKAQGWYDEALLVVTADHGKSFKPGTAKRDLAADNAGELLRVPLFVKAPGQREGGVSDRPVASIDILPTIADVLGSTLPWEVAGRSMLAPSFPERAEVDVDGKMRFSVETLEPFPGLAWQVDAFGSGTGLAELAARDGHPQLVGRPLGALSIGSPATDRRLEITDRELFADVDLTKDVLPALLTGRVQTEGSAPERTDLAIALNGVVRATTRTTAWAGHPGFFAAMLPEGAFRSGANTLTVLAVSGEDANPTLTPIPFADDVSGIVLERAGEREVLRFPDGRTVSVVGERIDGWVDRVVQDGPIVRFSGWAVDPIDRKPAATVLAFVDGKAVAVGSHSWPRTDVARLLGDAALEESGFAFQVMRRLLEAPHASIRVFAISPVDAADELKLTGGATCALDEMRGEGGSCGASVERDAG